jgi:hypothetical protein
MALNRALIALGAIAVNGWTLSMIAPGSAGFLHLCRLVSIDPITSKTGPVTIRRVLFPPQYPDRFSTRFCPGLTETALL